MTSTDRSRALDVVARGMVDNPLHVAAYGSDAARRVRLHRAVVEAGLDILGTDVLCLTVDGAVVGAAGLAAPGRCQPSLRQRLRFMPVLATLGPSTAHRLTGWLTTWATHDPSDPHVHIGPVAVHPDLQGRGLGTRLMSEVCASLDRQGATGYLETDRRENLPFYARLGFRVVGSAAVIGVPNWFMSRPPGDPRDRPNGPRPRA